MKGKLYLVPVTLGSAQFKYVIPDSVLDIIKSLRYFIVEDIRSARRFLRLIDPEFPIDDSVFMILNEHTGSIEYESMLKYLKMGSDTGIMSEAGVPGIADPGSPVVRLAHKNNIQVIPLSGPSSIIMAMIASGMNGQRFTFNGYIPVKKPERIIKLKELNTLASKGHSQIFMETPYRNISLFKDILESCSPGISLCLAVNISLADESIRTLTINEWRKLPIPEIHKCPAIFILG